MKSCGVHRKNLYFIARNFQAELILHGPFARSSQKPTQFAKKMMLDVIQLPSMVQARSICSPLRLTHVLPLRSNRMSHKSHNQTHDGYYPQVLTYTPTLLL